MQSYYENVKYIKHNSLQDSLKDIVINELNVRNIKCYSSNIKLFDLDNYSEIQSFDDLIKYKTKRCKIIIKPINYESI